MAKTTSPRRVLIVSHYYDPEPLPKAGELARALRARGHDVRVVTGLPCYPAGHLYDGYRLGLRQRERRDGVWVTRTFEVPYHGPSAAGRLANYASTAVSLAFGGSRTWSPDAVYVWAPPPTTILPAYALLRRLGGPKRSTGGPRIVMDVQDLWPDFGLLSGVLHDGPIVGATRRIAHSAYRLADQIIVPTDGYRRALLDTGLADDRVDVLPNWIPDDNAVVPAPEAVRAARRAEGWDDRFVVLFAGNLGGAQGLDTVLEAAAASGADTCWAFAGDGTDRAQLEATATSRGLTDRVRFLGRRDPTEMPTLAGAADALLVHLRPSGLSDVVVPTKVNGYLAYGRPIVCALAGEGAELVRRAEAGVVVPPGDPVAILDGVRRLQALDPAERFALGENGRAFARRELVASALLGRYEDALGIAEDPTERQARRRRRVPTPVEREGLDREAMRRPALVTGATGSLGPAVVATLRASGVPVRVLVRDPSAQLDPDVEVVVGDLRDPVAVRAAVEGCDTVVHLAALVHRKGPGTDEGQRTVTGNAACSLFAIAADAGVRRVVLASSISVYGPDGTFDEDSPLRPTGAYGRAKVRAEQDLLGHTNPESKPLGTILRFATCYGPDAAGNVTAMFDALARHRFAMIGAGRNRKSLLHVDDAATSVLLAAYLPVAAGRVYDVSDGDPLPLRDIVDTMCEVLGRRRPAVTIPDRPLSAALEAAVALANRVNRPLPVPEVSRPSAH